MQVASDKILSKFNVVENFEIRINYFRLAYIRI